MKILYQNKSEKYHFTPIPSHFLSSNGLVLMLAFYCKADNSPQGTQHEVSYDTVTS